MNGSQELSHEELLDLFQRLFPHGFCGPDVMRVLAPDGWERSGLVRAFHPTFDQWHQERVRYYHNTTELDELFARRRGKIPTPRHPPTVEKSRQEFCEIECTPIDATKECTELVGMSCWSIFSNEHTVVASDGRAATLGSWRMASAFLDEFVDSAGSGDPLGRGDNMRFYMGFTWLEDRCDFGPVYRMVFQRLRREGLNWRYSLPRLSVSRLEKAEGPVESYSPSEALSQEVERREEDAEFEGLQAELEKAHLAAAEKARHSPPPAVVQAYRDVYGDWPEGWPP